MHSNEKISRIDRERNHQDNDHIKPYFADFKKKNNLLHKFKVNLSRNNRIFKTETRSNAVTNDYASLNKKIEERCKKLIIESEKQASILISNSKKRIGDQIKQSESIILRRLDVMSKFESMSEQSARDNNNYRSNCPQRSNYNHNNQHLNYGAYAFNQNSKSSFNYNQSDMNDNNFISDNMDQENWEIMAIR